MRKLFYLVVSIVIFGLIISGCFFHVVPPLSQDGSTNIVKDGVSYQTNLIAGQHTVAGSVTVSNDGENLFVTYETSEGWLMNVTHLYVDTIVPTKSAPGKFPYKHEELGGVTTDTYEIPLDDLGVGPCDVVYIAAHAELVKGETEEAGWAEGVKIRPGKNWAMYFEYQIPSPAPSEPEIEFKEVVSAQIDLEVGGVVEVTDESSEIYGTRFVIDENKFKKNNINNKTTKSTNVNVVLILVSAFKHQIGDYQGFLITPIVVMSDSDDEITGTLEIEYSEDKLSNSGVEKNATVNVYRLKTTGGNMFATGIDVIPIPVSGATWEKVSENKYSDENNIIKISIGPGDFEYYYTLTVTDCKPPDNLGNPLPGDLVYRLSNYGDNDNWLPGHVGIYVGTRYDEEDGVYNVIEELGIWWNPFSGGVIRTYYPDITEFGNGPTYMGAREPNNQSLNHIHRNIIVDYVDLMVGLPYAFFETFGVYFGWARGDYVKGTDIIGSFNCVGLAEKAYEIAGVNNYEGLVSDYDEGNLPGVLDPDRILSPQEQFCRTVPASGIIENTAPDIFWLEMVPENPKAGDSVSITCHASDQDGDDPSYEWTIKDGSGNIIDNFDKLIKGKQIDFQIPSIASNYKIICRVFDNYGGEAIIYYEGGLESYTITASAGSHGSISPSGDVTVNEGSNQSFTITPDSGYQIADVKVNGNSIGAVSSHTFSNVNENHTISATFNATPTNTVSNVVAVYWTDHYPSNSQNIEHLINVFWDPYPEASGYKVYRSVNGVAEAEPIYNGPGELLYDKNVVQWHDLSNIEVGNTYSYYVTAYGDGWETAPSQEVGSINTFLPPIYLVSPSDGETINNSTPTFEWSPVGANPGGSINFGTTELWVKDLTDDKVTWDILFNDMTTSDATYNQDGQASPLILGHSYAWEVTNYGSVDNMEVAISQSEYWEFTYGTVTGSVHNLTKDTYYDTIQAALDDADSLGGDTIEVSDGTYDESITFPSGKNIILQSINGASLTTIRGNDVSSTVILDGSLEGSTLEGFTITHASGNRGGGIWTDSYLAIKNCIISGNAGYAVGGIGNGENSSITIIGSTISDNTGDMVGGIGNFYCGSITITESTISGNTCTDAGSGGINNQNSSLIIIKSTISGNVGQQGGGIFNHEGSITIIGSTISGNVGQYAGGIFDSFGPCSITITGSTISGNSTYYGNSGIYFNYLTSGTLPIGGNSDADKNTICGNYQTYFDPSLAHQIRDYSGSLYEAYKDTNIISAYCN